MKKKERTVPAGFWLLVWGLGLAGQLCWNMENQWFNTFVYAHIAKDPTIISWMTAVSAAATTVSTFVFGTLSDRRGTRKPLVAWGYILWGVFTILFGMTQFITGGSAAPSAQTLLVAGFAVVAADAIMSFFGSMGNDSGFNAWMNDHMTDKNRGQLGGAIAVQPVIGTIVGTVAGGMLVGSDDNYLRLFCVMGGAVIAFGVFALVCMKDSPDLSPHKQGTFLQQLAYAFNFKRYFALRELVWVNLLLAVYFIAFNMYFTHLGNYMIYYLGFDAGTMGLIEGIALLVAMLVVIPAGGMLNRGLAPQLCGAGIVLSSVGTLVLGLFVRPESVDVTTVLNPVLLGGVFLLGLGYILFLQAVTVWSKQLYPADARGQFEGIRILFFVLIPMVVAPLLSNPIIKRSGEYVDENGFTAYLPTHTLLLAGSAMVLLSIIPLVIAAKHHKKRTAAAAQAK